MSKFKLLSVALLLAMGTMIQTGIANAQWTPTPAGVQPAYLVDNYLEENPWPHYMSYNHKDPWQLQGLSDFFIYDVELTGYNISELQLKSSNGSTFYVQITNNNYTKLYWTSGISYKTRMLVDFDNDVPAEDEIVQIHIWTYDYWARKWVKSPLERADVFRRVFFYPSG